MSTNRITLAIATIAALTAFVPAGNAMNVSDGCDDNTTTFGDTILENTIMAAPGAFVGVGGSPTPGAVAGQRVGPQSTPAGNTPPVETQPVPVPAQVTPPRVQTNWTPDCVTIENGNMMTWTNGDGEAVHAPELGVTSGRCWKAPAALIVPFEDKDDITFTYDEQTGNVIAHILSVRQANTAAPGTPLIQESTFTCTPLQLAIKQKGPISAPEIDIPGLVVDEENRVADLAYTCILHHAAMTGHVKIHF